MTKPMVFNYADHERALEEIARLKEDIANLQIRCWIAESEKPDRDCKTCKHNKPDGCSRWECEYVPRMDDIISRADAIEAIASRDETDGTVEVFTGRQVNEILESLPSAEQVTSKLNKRYDSLLADDFEDGKTQESKLDLISRQDAIEAVEAKAKWFNGDAIEDRCKRDAFISVIDDVLTELPSANRPTGEWIAQGDCGVTKCNRCGWSIEECIDYNYCPNCGAKMGGESE